MYRVSPGARGFYSVDNHNRKHKTACHPGRRGYALPPSDRSARWAPHVLSAVRFVGNQRPPSPTDGAESNLHSSPRNAAQSSVRSGCPLLGARTLPRPIALQLDANLLKGGRCGSDPASSSFSASAVRRAGNAGCATPSLCAVRSPSRW